MIWIVVNLKVYIFVFDYELIKLKVFVFIGVMFIIERGVNFGGRWKLEVIVVWGLLLIRRNFACYKLLENLWLLEVLGKDDIDVVKEVL